ncbi:MAG: diheme cytochrome C [Cyanobacteria bacterium J06648_10]
MLSRWSVHFKNSLIAFFRQLSVFNCLQVRPIRLGACAIALSIALGINLANAIEPSTPTEPTSSSSPYGMVDPIDTRYEAGYRTYLNNCATCHVALPPAVLPIPTWQTLITDTAHYGISLPQMLPFDQQLTINYLQAYSRQHQSRGPVPYRLKDSAYFQALHPNVAFAQPVNIRSCTSCHIAAPQQDYTQIIEPMAADPTSTSPAE